MSLEVIDFGRGEEVSSPPVSLFSSEFKPPLRIPGCCLQVQQGLGISVPLLSHLHPCMAQVSTPEQAGDWGDWAGPGPPS